MSRPQVMPVADAMADAETLRLLGEARVLLKQASLPGERWPLHHAAEILPYANQCDVSPEYYGYVAQQDVRAAFRAVPALREARP